MFRMAFSDSYIAHKLNVSDAIMMHAVPEGTKMAAVHADIEITGREIKD